MYPHQHKAPLQRPPGIAGPAIGVLDQRMPCGCRLDKDQDKKQRIYYCPAHAYAYEMLEALQEATKVVDALVSNAPPDWDVTQAMEAGMKARRVLKKVKGAEWRG